MRQYCRREKGKVKKGDEAVRWKRGRNMEECQLFRAKYLKSPTFGNLSVRSEAESSHMRICGKERVATTELLMVA